MKLHRVVIATRNPGKLREFHELLRETGWQILGLAEAGITEECEETGNTFMENARIKALHYSRRTTLPVLADDSGLEVDALDGGPGIRSARYAGSQATDSDRIERLLKELEPVAPERRNARFVCALVMAAEGNILAEVEGECRGTISDTPRGSGGFGYDPVFRFPELGRTYAELEPAEKNRLSHRAHAVRLMVARLGRLTSSRPRQ